MTRLLIARDGNQARLLELLAEAGAGLSTPEDLGPEIQEALAEHMRNYEKQWLDMAIPALHGLTPREAVDDPTRRDDLLRLLASFEDGDDGPMKMSPRAGCGPPQTAANSVTGT